MKQTISFRWFIYMCFCLLVCGAQTHAIEYSGVVMNEIGRPADKAAVTVTNVNDPSDTYTVVTDTTGVFSFSITDVAEETPVSFALHGNFPNPFNPATRISYSIDRTADVRIDIYNILGQQVRLIDQGQRMPGFYTAVWDGRDEQGRYASAGVYVYRLSAGDRSLASKMMMVDNATGSWIGTRAVPSEVFKKAAEPLYTVTVTHDDALVPLVLGPLSINGTSDTVLTFERDMHRMMRVKKNTYTRGTDKRYYPHVYPAHPVTITHDMMMDRFEVTIMRYCEVINHAIDRGAIELVDGEAYNLVGERKLLFRYEEPGMTTNLLVVREGDHVMPREGRDLLPMCFITWYGSMMYCHERSLIEGYSQAINLDDWSVDIYSEGYRLPTDAEWELAARWIDDREYAFGPDPGYYKPMNVQLNEDGFDDLLSPVGWYSPQGDSHDGLADVSGNVYEWVLDWQGEYQMEWVETGVVDPTGPEGRYNKACRGGSANGCFRSARTYDKAHIRVTDTRLNIGLRSVRRVDD